MRLTGARVALSARCTERIDLAIDSGRIQFVPAGTGDIDLGGYLLLPGLINAHDHLEFNLFPQLGRRIYEDAVEWAADIHRPEASPVREHLAIPKHARLTWGGIRNLLSGVTTVAHHNPYESAVFDAHFPVRVLKEFGWAHSLAFSSDIVDLFRRNPPDWPFIVHAAEGTGARAASEIRQLDELGVLSENTVLVHAIGMAPGDLEILRRRRSSIVWCPRSNLATYRRTLASDTLRSGIPVALGTDSAISAEGDLLDEIRFAHVLGGLSREEIYDMVTRGAAQVLRLSHGQGSIREGGVANLVAVRDEGQSPADAIFNLQPALVIVGGRIKLVAQDFASLIEQFEPIHLESRGSWLIDASVAALHRAAVQGIGPDCRLAGRAVSP